MKPNPLFICTFVLVSTSLALEIFASVTHVVQKRASGKVQAAYFSNWCVLCCLESLHYGLAVAD